MSDQPVEQLKNDSVTQLFPVSSGSKHRDMLQIANQPFNSSEETNTKFLIELK